MLRLAGELHRFRVTVRIIPATVLLVLVLVLAACRFEQGTSGGDALVDAGAAPDAVTESSADAGVEPRTVRIATANLRCLIEDWDQRVRVIAEDIVRVSPEIIALQEVCREPGGRDALDDLRWEIELIGGGAFESVRAQTHRAWEQYDEGIVVMVRAPILESRVVELPKGAFPRKAIIVRLQSSAGALVFAGTHLSFGSDRALVRQVQLGAARDAVAAMRQPGDAIAIAGDFNETPGSPAVSAALGAGYTDAWAAAQPSDPGLTVPSSAPESRIDYLLVGGLEVASAGQFMDTPRQGVWPSDHRGVWADVIAGE